MAIFASTTLGTGDPSRAMSIKALEARAQALAAAQAKQEMPTSLPSPWQGAALVTNQLGDALATKRADQQAAEQKQQLANLMGQIGPEGPNPQQLAGITARDEAMGKMYAQQAFDARQSASQVAAQKEAAAQKAQYDKDYLATQEKALGERPSTDEAAVVERAFKRGEIDQTTRDARLKKITAPPEAERKAADTQEDLNVDLQSTIAGLKEGQGLLHSGKVYSGGGAEFKEGAGKWLPNSVGSFVGVDPESTKATQRYNQIVSPQVLDLLAKLKGASSDRDMKWAIDVLNDKSADIETKKRAMDTLIPKVGAHLELNQRRLKEMGREPVKVDIPPPTASEAPAAAAGAPAAVAGGAQSVASEAEALALPPGTKFKLPDGRTGTAR